MKTFLMSIALTVALVFMSIADIPVQFPVETGIRQECGGNHRHAPDTPVCRRCGAPFDV